MPEKKEQNVENLGAPRAPASRESYLERLRQERIDQLRSTVRLGYIMALNALAFNKKVAELIPKEEDDEIDRERWLQIRLMLRQKEEREKSLESIKDNFINGAPFQSFVLRQIKDFEYEEVKYTYEGPEDIKQLEKLRVLLLQLRTSFQNNLGRHPLVKDARGEDAYEQIEIIDPELWVFELLEREEDLPDMWARHKKAYSDVPDELGWLFEVGELPS